MTGSLSVAASEIVIVIMIVVVSGSPGIQVPTAFVAIGENSDT